MDKRKRSLLSLLKAVHDLNCTINCKEAQQLHAAVNLPQVMLLLLGQHPQACPRCLFLVLLVLLLVPGQCPASHPSRLQQMHLLLLLVRPCPACRPAG
jgi:hypothetical protein